MPEVKIGVGANVGGVDQALNKITASMNKLGAAVSANQKLKFEPTDVKTMARDLDLINKQFKQTLALSAQVRNALKASGQGGLHLSQIDWSKTSTDPRAAQRMRDRAFMHSVRGTSLDPSLSNAVDAEGNAVSTAKQEAKQAAKEARDLAREESSHARDRARADAAEAKRAAQDRNRPGGFGRGASRYASGMAGRTAGAFSGGIGGPIGGILQEGVQGAGSGFSAGGILGGLGGGLAGLAGGGAIALAAAAGKAIYEGVDQAKSRSIDLDTLKRSMGDLGVSFNALSEDAWKFGKGLGMANGEFVKLEQQANQNSGGAYRNPFELGSATRSGVELSRAYGLQPGQGVGFVSGMQRLNSRQNNKELAVTLADAIVNAQGKSTAGEVMQAMQGFAAAQNRFNSGSIDLTRFGNAYDSMLRGGMTADHASSILGQANSSMQQMGGTEASRNFTMQAFGNLDPIRAAMRAEGGLFGNGLDNSDISRYMGPGWNDGGTGPSGTNFSVMRGAFDKAYSGRGRYGREMELDAEKNYFGLRSYADTASFMNMSDSDHNGIAGLLKRSGMSVSDIREGGIAAIGQISKTSNFGDLDKLYQGSIRGRGDMSDADKSSMDRAEKSGNFSQFQKELVRVLAGKGQEDDAGSTQRTIDANIADMKTMIGEKLLPYTQAIMTGILAMANKIPGVNIEDPTMAGPPRSAKRSLVGAIAASHIDHKVGGDGWHTYTGGTAWDKLVDAGQGLFNKAKRGVYGARLDGLESQYALPKGLMMGVWGAETSYGRRNVTSSAGAKGNFQMLDPTAAQYGVKIGDFASESDGAARMYRDLLKVNHGNLSKALGAYNWGQGNLNKDIAAHGDDWLAHAPKETQNYIAKIEKSMGMDANARADDARGDIVIQLNQTMTTPGGQQRTKVLSTRVQKPAASGAQVPVILAVPN